jgi:hypothetical protein
LRKRADEYFASRVPKLPPLTADPTEGRLYFWQSLSPEKENLPKRYGAKGTNFAILDNALRAGGFDRSDYAGGFLIPFSYYERHLSQKLADTVCAAAKKKCDKAGYSACEAPASSCQTAAAAGLSLRELITKLTSDLPGQQLVGNAALRKSTLEFIQEAIKASPFAAKDESDLREAILKNYPENRRIRFRSSTNAEDLPGLTGAGLYESESACLADDQNTSGGSSACMTEVERSRIQEQIAHLQERDSEKYAAEIESLQKKLKKKHLLPDAIRKVFASTWNEKAFLSRDYYGLDHSAVHMGILVHPAFADERANGVALLEERDGSTGNELLANITVQKDDVSITNPVINWLSPENIVAVLGASDSLTDLRYTRLSSLGNPLVLETGAVQSLMAQLRVVYDAMKVANPQAEQMVFDSEFMLSSKGEILIKQVRPLRAKRVP